MKSNNAVDSLKRLHKERREARSTLEDLKSRIEEIEGQESNPVIKLRNAFVEKAGHSLLKSEEGGFDCLCGIGDQHDERQLRVLEEVLREHEISLKSFVERWAESLGPGSGLGFFSKSDDGLAVEGCGSAADVFEVAASLLDEKE